MRMEWTFGLMEIGMIHIICLLTEFILNGVVLYKVYNNQNTKKKATSMFFKQEKMWRGVLVCCGQDGS